MQTYRGLVGFRADCRVSPLPPHEQNPLFLFAYCILPLSQVAGVAAPPFTFSLGEYSMKRAEPRKPDSDAAGTRVLNDPAGNGHRPAELSEADLGDILIGLQTMRDGDFSVRLPGTWTGVGGKIADCFNEIIVANQRMGQELKREGHVVGREGKIKGRTSVYDER